MVLLALVLSTTVAGCAMTFDATSLGVPAAMASPSPVAGDTFNVRTHATYLFWGLYTGGAPNLGRTLQGQLAGGRGVQNLRIHVSRRWSDLLITVLTAGLVDPVSVTFQGVITPALP